MLSPQTYISLRTLGDELAALRLQKLEQQVPMPRNLATPTLPAIFQTSSEAPGPRLAGTRITGVSLNLKFRDFWVPDNSPRPSGGARL